MFFEYEETLPDFLQALSTNDPDKFTSTDWALVRFYVRSDGCTRVPDIYVKSCWEHDFYFRTHHDFCGHVISFREANRRFRIRIQRLSRFGVCSPVSWWRWLGVALLGRSAWAGKKSYR